MPAGAIPDRADQFDEKLTRDLLQSTRDELGRLNQRYRFGEKIALAVTVYRFDHAGMWSGPTAHYGLVARDQHGQVV
jgi:hypothetical protein